MRLKVEEKGRLLSRMLVLATEAHAGQQDRGGRPYILHPLQVMQLLGTDDEELQCVALGHDLIEDTDVTAEKLRTSGFSERVVTAIVALTRVLGDSEPDYRARVCGNSDAVRVKLCDLTHNLDVRRLSEIGPGDIKRTEKYRGFHAELTAVALRDGL